METLLEAGLNAIAWLQNSYPQLAPLMTIVSQLGTINFYLAILPLIYWTIHKTRGRRLLYMLTIVNLLVAIGKHALRQPRPYWLDNTLALSEEATYGVPSGHAAAAGVFYMLLAGYIGNRWGWAAAIFATLLMGFSRIYLGVHFIHDVALGYLLAFILLVLYLAYYRYGKLRFERRILGQRLLLALAIPATLGLTYGAIYFLLDAPDPNVAWASFSAEGEREGVEGAVAGIASLLGFGIGFLLEGSRVRFREEGTDAKKFLRYLAGMLILSLLFFGGRIITPTEPQWLELIGRAVRYFLSTIWVAYYAPMLFKRFGLADADPDPGIQVGMRRRLVRKDKNGDGE